MRNQSAVNTEDVLRMSIANFPNDACYVIDPITTLSSFQVKDLLGINIIFHCDKPGGVFFIQGNFKT